jgi:hypothetical protein
MAHNIYVTWFYGEIEAKNSSTNLLLTLRSWSYNNWIVHQVGYDCIF